MLSRYIKNTYIVVLPTINQVFMKQKHIPRDISWLSFNARVLQEANDNSVPLQERIRFLGIFSNNLDEFFRVRVATLKRMVEFVDKKKKVNIDLIALLLLHHYCILTQSAGNMSRVSCFNAGPNHVLG